MKMNLKKLLLLCIFLVSCSSTQEESPESALLHALPDQPQAPGSDRVLFVKLQKQEQEWKVLSMESKRMPVNILAGEERVYIHMDTQQVMPDFDFYQYSDEDKRLFNCSHAVDYNRHTTYNPCTSELTKNTKFGDGWFGWTKQLDVIQLNKLVKQTDLLAKSTEKFAQVTRERQRCANVLKQAELATEKQKIALRVIDETGMYSEGHKHVSYGLDILPIVAKEGCEQELGDIKLSYNMDIVQGSNLVLEMRGKSNWSRIDKDKLFLERDVADVNKALLPTLYITGKQVNRYNLYKVFANEDVQLTWRTIDISDTDLRQKFDIKSLSASQIEIKQLSFYINHHTVTKKDSFKVAPVSSANSIEHASRYFMLDKKEKEKVDAIKVINSKDEKAQFGIKLTYAINGELKVLEKKKTLLLTSAL